ncbi:MAG: DNA-formamidopyrimidine glycosylase [Candidatus Sungbacteria bacterium]|nr:DNA-formamidopyrimidine glycosylase [Candidatus Sungbacteria bacterium]
MPELPEVETTVRALRHGILRKKIRGASASAHQLFEDKRLFKTIGALLRGDSFTSISRHGKYLTFHLKSGRVMLAHMKMTGHFLIISVRRPIGMIRRYAGYIRFWIKFADGTKLLFSDVRKFGRIWLIPKSRLAGFFSGRKIAKDALDIGFTEEYLKSQILSDRNIKALLLDQTRIAGLGNIYTDEILWRAKINPLRRGTDLTEKEVKRILAAIRYTLYAGIKAGGSSIRDYRKPDGSPGYFQTKRAVYQRAGEPCPKCGAKIKRIVVAQRGTHYCPKCQKL